MITHKLTLTYFYQQVPNHCGRILKLNSVPLVRKQTIPTERPPLVGEVSANFCRQRVSRGQHNGIPRPLISGF
jgi:hypothetical protein